MRAFITTTISALCLSTQIHASTTCTSHTMSGNWMLDIGTFSVGVGDGNEPDEVHDVNLLCDLDLSRDQSYSGTCYVPYSGELFAVSGTLTANRNCVLSGVLLLNADGEWPLTLEGRVTSDARVWPGLIIGVAYFVDPVNSAYFDLARFSMHRRPWDAPLNLRDMPLTPLAQSTDGERSRTLSFRHHRNN